MRTNQRLDDYFDHEAEPCAAVREAIKRYKMEGSVTAPTQASVAVTAAARVGEYQKLGIDPANPNPDGSDFHLMNAVDEIKNATIERCARVADSYVKIAMAMPTSVIDTVCRDITDAIRKLAKEPVYGEHLRKLRDEP